LGAGLPARIRTDIDLHIPRVIAVPVSSVDGQGVFGFRAGTTNSRYQDEQPWKRGTTVRDNVFLQKE
jgi:hypothetical protein